MKPSRSPICLLMHQATAYIVADQRLYQAQGSTFLAREDFTSFAIKAIPGNWLITANERGISIA